MGGSSGGGNLRSESCGSCGSWRRAPTAVGRQIRMESFGWRVEQLDRKGFRPWDVRAPLNLYIYLLLSPMGAQIMRLTHIFCIYFLAVHWRFELERLSGYGRCGWCWEVRTSGILSCSAEVCPHVPSQCGRALYLRPPLTTGNGG